MRCSAYAAVAIALALHAGSADAGTFDKGPYLQNISRSSVTIMWQSSRGLAGQVTVFADPAITQASDVTSGIHEATIGGLQPGRRYRYVVSSGSDTRAGEFATAPQAGAPFSFVVFGDSRSNEAAHQRVVERVRREVPDFILGTGDMVDKGGTEADWQNFFDIERELLAENVLYPSLGNHDRQGRGKTADNYRKYFCLPENSPDPERYYAFTYGSARFLILDSNAYSFALTDQTAWIEDQMQAARLDPSIEHIFVSMHHPPFSVSLHGGQEELREAWTPLFEKYQVGAVFSGHDHVYSRAERSGVRYFVSGGGGAPLYPRKKNSDDIDIEATRYFERVNHYLRVHVFGRHVEVTAVRSDGTTIETTSWGSQPQLDPAHVAALGAGKLPGAPARSAATPAQAPSSPSVPTGPFGWLGLFGAALVLGAAGVLAWNIR